MLDEIRDAGYGAMGWAHARLDGALRTVRGGERGQGTVEYIGLVLLLAAVMAAVVTSGNGSSIAKTVISKVKEAVAGVGAGKGG